MTRNRGGLISAALESRDPLTEPFHARRIRETSADDTASSTADAAAQGDADRTEQPADGQSINRPDTSASEPALEPEHTDGTDGALTCAERPIGPIFGDREEGMKTKRRPKRGTDAAQLAAVKGLSPRPRGRPRTERSVDMRRKPESLDDAQLLERAIRASGEMTDAEFAEQILYVNPRTLRKYREGRTLKRLQREKLLDYIAEQSR